MRRNSPWLSGRRAGRRKRGAEVEKGKSPAEEVEAGSSKEGEEARRSTGKRLDSSSAMRGVSPRARLNGTGRTPRRAHSCCFSGEIAANGRMMRRKMRDRSRRSHACYRSQGYREWLRSRTDLYDGPGHADAPAHALRLRSRRCRVERDGPRSLMNAHTPAPASLPVHSPSHCVEDFTGVANLASMLDCARIRYRSV